MEADRAFMIWQAMVNHRKSCLVWTPFMHGKVSIKKLPGTIAIKNESILYPQIPSGQCELMLSKPTPFKEDQALRWGEGFISGYLSALLG
ncbi:MAG: hypothetical protein ACPGL0_03380 [Limisphaerales bacterium]